MNSQTGFAGHGPIATDPSASVKEAAFSKASSAFALSAAVTVIFNTLLAWVKDAYDPLNTAMAHLTGHHWITHGLVDVIVFFALGGIFLSTGVAERFSPNALTVCLVGAVILAGLGLAAWFVVT
jgi:hypothetical protein